MSDKLAYVCMVGACVDSDGRLATITPIVWEFELGCNRHHCIIGDDICPRFEGTFGTTIMCRKEGIDGQNTQETGS